MLKILILRLSSIGDLILAAHILRPIKEKFPQSEIHWLVKKKFADIIKLLPDVDHIEIIQNKSEILQKRKVIKDASFSHIFDLQNNLWSRLLTLGIKNCYFSHKNYFNKQLLVLFGIRKNSEHLFPSAISRYYKPLKAINISRPSSELNINIKFDSFLRVKEKFTLPLPQTYFVITPFASYKNKEWPITYFQELIQLLEKWPIIILGNGEREKDLSIKHFTKFTNILNLVGKTNLEESLAIINKSRFLLTNDSGPMHMAQALRTPLIALFGPTTKHLGFFPFIKNSIVLENKTLSCRPCTLFGKHKCPKKHFKCMNEIKVQEVLTNIQPYLQRP